MDNRHPYPADRPAHAYPVIGTKSVWREFWSPELKNRRDITVYLPASYAGSNRRYPVIYMNDGENRFHQSPDFASAFGASQALEAIVVAIPTIRAEHSDEYNPFADLHSGPGRGDAYLRFIDETLKPRIDADFRTLPGTTQTGLLGSSTGGIISMYGLLRYPQTFGFAGVMSPAVCFNSCALLGYLLEAPYVPGRVYLDVDPVEDTGTFAYTRALRALLEAKGCKPGSDLFYVEEANKGYCETAWAYRVRHALQLLLDSGRPRSLQPDWPAFATMRSPDSGPTAIQN